MTGRPPPGSSAPSPPRGGRFSASRAEEAAAVSVRGTNAGKPSSMSAGTALKSRAKREKNPACEERGRRRAPRVRKITDPRRKPSLKAKSFFRERSVFSRSDPVFGARTPERKAEDSRGTGRRSVEIAGSPRDNRKIGKSLEARYYATFYRSWAARGNPFQPFPHYIPPTASGQSPLYTRTLTGFRDACP